MATPADVRLIATEFSDSTQYPDTTINVFLGYASANVNTAIFGARANYAQALLAAHFLKISVSKGNAQLREESDTQTKRVYFPPPGVEHEFTQTSYGVLFLGLRRANLLTPIVVMN